MLHRSRGILAAACAVCLAATLGAAGCGESEAAEKALTGVTLGGDYETRYLVGETFNRSGLAVTAHYDDGTEEVVTDYTCSPSAPLRKEDETVTVSYGGFDRTISIAVGENPLDSESVRVQFAKETYTDGTGTLNYRVRKPDRDDGPAPLVLFLHGASQRGDDNEMQLDLAILKTFLNFKNAVYDAHVIAPQCPSGKKWVDCDWSYGLYSVDQVAESAPSKLVYGLLQQYIAEENVDASRVYVMGLSMGGFGTWDMLMRHGELFAAGVPICGGADPTKAAELADIPIYTFHGTADQNINVDGTATVVEAIEREGKGLIHYVEFQGAGHVIWDQALAYAGDAQNPPTLKWLFAQKKGA